MAVVIRLQGLPIIAGPADIRHFFSGLHIPDGGVHITGGKHSEAFIIFATDEDARRAMSRSGGFIKKSQIELFLSSKAEIQHALEMNRKGKKDLGPALDISKLLNVMKKGMYQKNTGNKSNDEASFDDSGAKHKEENVPRPQYQGKKGTRPLKDNGYGYVFLCGLPYSATELEVKDFFHGFHVVDIRFSVRSNGARDGNAYVKFASVQDAKASLSRHYEYIGHRYVAVRLSTEQKWIEAGVPTNEMQESAPKTRERSPRFSSTNHSRSRSPKKHRTRSRSPHNPQFYLHLLNMSYSVERRDIKLFFGDPDIPDSQIKFLPDQNGERRKEGFMLVKNEKFYQKCLGFHKNLLNGCEVWVYPIARKDMLQIIESTERQQLERNTPEDPFQNKKSRDHSNLKRCIYLKNFPFNVSKSEVQKFFAGFQVDERDIFLLYDSIGVGLGEALVIFPSEHQAILAEGLNQQMFLGAEVLLRRISEEQMKEFGVFPEDHSEREPKRSTNIGDEYQETGEQRFVVSDYGHGSYDKSRPYRADDFGHGSQSIRRSMERLRSPNDMNQDEHYGRFSVGNQNVADYESGPVNRPRSGGASIYLKNVPYTSTIEDILDFFYGYNVVPDSVEMDYNSKGTAIVHMENYDVAAAAVNELNERPIGPRKVHMSLIRS